MEALERTKEFASEVWDRIRQGRSTIRHRSRSEGGCPIEPENPQRGWEYLDRAKAILDGRVSEIRYKILTLGELDISARRQLVGKDGEQRWNDGERVVAFEDGTLAFKESGSEHWGTLEEPDYLACWIGILDSFPQRWEAGPSSKIGSMQIH